MRRAPPATPAPAVGGIQGGRYRIRAWKAPDLALTAPQIIFLGGTENRTISLGLSRYSGSRVTTSIAPDPPVVDEETSLALLVTTRSVDGEGVVRSIGVPSVSLRLEVSRAWQIVETSPSTDGSGRASFLLRLPGAGRHPIRVIVGGTESFDVPVRRLRRGAATEYRAARIGSPGLVDVVTDDFDDPGHRRQPPRAKDATSAAWPRW